MPAETLQMVQRHGTYIMPGKGNTAQVAVIEICNVPESMSPPDLVRLVMALITCDVRQFGGALVVRGVPCGTRAAFSSAFRKSAELRAPCLAVAEAQDAKPVIVYCNYNEMGEGDVFPDIILEQDVGFG